MDSRAPVVDTADLLQWATAVLVAVGTPDDIAAETSRHLVGANRAGHDSHGVQRLPGYLADVAQGELHPAARPRVVRSRPGSMLVDAQRGFGAYSTAWVANELTDLAGRQGVAFAAVRQSCHIGRLGHYAELCAGHGLISITAVGMAGDGVGATVIPGTSRRFLGANPYAIGVPTNAEPMIVDLSTATVAEGKIMLARSRGDSVPEGLIVDRDGHPSTVPDDYFAGGGLLPLGGVLSGYKGFGLGLAAALLGSLAVIDDADPTMIGAGVTAGADPVGRTAGVAMVVLDPAAFGDPEAYAAHASDTVAALRRRGGVSPGDPERAARRERETAVELPGPTREALVEVGREYGVPWPGERR